MPQATPQAMAMATPQAMAMATPMAMPMATPIPIGAQPIPMAVAVAVVDTPAQY